MGEMSTLDLHLILHASWLVKGEIFTVQRQIICYDKTVGMRQQCGPSCCDSSSKIFWKTPKALKGARHSDSIISWNGRAANTVGSVIRLFHTVGKENWQKFPISFACL